MDLNRTLRALEQTNALTREDRLRLKHAQARLLRMWMEPG